MLPLFYWRFAMTTTVDQVVLIESALYNTEYRLAKVVTQTNKTVQVAMWHPRIKNWNEETKRRNASAILKILGPDDDFTIEQLQKADEQLRSADAERQERIRRAELAHHKKMLEFKIK